MRPQRPAAAAATGGALCVPRIAAGAEQRGFGERREPEFRRIGFSKNDQSGLPHFLHHKTVGGRNIIQISTAAGTHRCTLHLDAQVFYQKRYTGKGRLAADGFGRCPRFFVDFMDHGVEHRIQCFGAADGDFNQFFGFDFPFFDQIGQAKGIVAAVFFKCHVSIAVNGP